MTSMTSDADGRWWWVVRRGVFRDAVSSSRSGGRRRLEAIVTASTYAGRGLQHADLKYARVMLNPAVTFFPAVTA